MWSGGSPGVVLPPVKNVVIYRNGDPFHCGRRFVVNQRQVATMEAFLNDVTQNIQAPLAVRSLYTPRQGTRVRELTDLRSGEQYVAAGFERFKKLDYVNSGQKKQPGAHREGSQTRVIQRPNVSAKWRKFIPLPCVIHVFRNGDVRCPPFRLLVPRSRKQQPEQQLEQVLSLVTDRAGLRTGAVRRLCTLDGMTLTSADQLETGHYYVAVGTERFKKLPYVELLVPKATERHHPGPRRLWRRHESRKAASVPEDRYRDSALLDSPESDGRRVKSTGNEAGEGPTLQVIQRRSGKEESSIFHARPVKVHKNWGQPTPPPWDRAAQSSVFKGGAQMKREELRGAEEVQEDENTAVEIPVDQRVAETVEDEDLRERDRPLPDSTGHGQTPPPETEDRNGRALLHSDEERHKLRDEMRQTEPQGHSSDNPRPSPDRPRPSPGSPRPSADRPHPSADRPHPSPDNPRPSPDNPRPSSDNPRPSSDNPRPSPDRPRPSSGSPRPSPGRPHPSPDRPRPSSVYREEAVIDGPEAPQEHMEQAKSPEQEDSQPKSTFVHQEASRETLTQAPEEAVPEECVPRTASSSSRVSSSSSQGPGDRGAGHRDSTSLLSSHTPKQESPVPPSDTIMDRSGGEEPDAGDLTQRSRHHSDTQLL